MLIYALLLNKTLLTPTAVIFPIIIGENSLRPLGQQSLETYRKSEKNMAAVSPFFRKLVGVEVFLLKNKAYMSNFLLPNMHTTPVG